MGEARTAWQTDPVATGPTTRNLGRISEIAQVAVKHGFGYFFETHRLTDLLPARLTGTRVFALTRRFRIRIRRDGGLCSLNLEQEPCGLAKIGHSANEGSDQLA